MDITPCKSFQRDDLEVTRNPFDSREFDKENLPAFSPSIFVPSACRSSEKKNKSFRWSIDQIAALKPAEIDEFPNQEYSASYEREEDELAAQNAITEYFSHITLPSPWTRNEKHAFKRVTFSPHPPTYFKEKPNQSDGSSGDISTDSQNDGGKNLVDACCQTNLTIPPDFDLQTVLGNSLFTYQEPEVHQNAKELNISTLRRKLFSQGDTSPERDQVTADRNDNNQQNQRNGLKSTASTPRTPRTPNWVTSSPCRDATPKGGLASDAESVLQSSFLGDPLNSPVLSPIKDAEEDIAQSFSKLESPDTSFDFSISSITDSPLRSKKLVSSDLETSTHDPSRRLVAFDIQNRVNTMSVEPSDSVVDIKESTRVAPMDPGFSPIKQDDAMDISVVSSSKLLEYDMQYNGVSVKESTANYIHGITGLFSPIKGSRNASEIKCLDHGENSGSEDHIEKADNESVDDGGPLEVSDLSLPLAPHRTDETDSQDPTDQSDDVFEAPVVIVSPYPTPKRGILKNTVNRGSSNRAAKGNEFENRFEKIEEKLEQVQERIGNVVNNYEKDIKEIKKTLTPMKDNFDGLRNRGNLGTNDFDKRKSTPGKGLANNDERSSKGVSDDFGRAFTGDSDVRKLPLRDRTNCDNYGVKNAERMSNLGSNLNMELVVRKGYSALNRAKKVSRRIDEDFDLCFEKPSGAQRRVSRDEDRESAEVADILGSNSREIVAQEQDVIQFARQESDGGISRTFENKFKDYRLQSIRESLNDSWDVRSRGTMDIAEMDSSLLPRRDSRAPTPIMNLAGLSIYNPKREHMIPHSVPRPIAMDRRRVAEGGKIERRNTWPSTKQPRYVSTYGNRTISPTFPSRYRTSRNYSFTKQDVVNKLKEEWKSRPPSRTGFVTLIR